MLKTKLSAAFISFIIIVSACGKKMMPDGSSKETNNKEKSNTANNTDEKKTVITGASTGKATEGKAGMMGSGVSAQTKQETTPQPVQPIASGPQKSSYEDMGSSLYSSKCSRCHAAKDPANYTWSQWGGILKKMIPNAKLTNDEEDYVRAYIKANCKQ